MVARFFVPREDLRAYEADVWEQNQLTKVADQWERNALQRLNEQVAPPPQPTAAPSDFLQQQQQRLGWSSGSEELAQPFGQAQEHVQRLTSQVNPSIPTPPPEPEPAPVAAPPDLRSLNTTGEQYTSPESMSPPGGGSSPFGPQPATAPSPAGSLVDYARQAAQRAGIDPDMFVRQINQESSFRTNAVSGAGATGVAQIVPRFHPNVNPNNPTEALDYAANLMASHKRTYGRDDLALVAYNGGQGAVNAWQAGRPYGESQQYVSRILGGAGGPSPSVSTQDPGKVAAIQSEDWQQVARDQLGKPYIWGSKGGRSDFSDYAEGFDCSGFVSYVWRNGLGVNMPAYTGDIYKATQGITREDAQPGDLVMLMKSGDATQQHVGIYLGNGQMINSTGGGVQVEPVWNGMEFRRDPRLADRPGSALGILDTATETAEKRPNTPEEQQKAQLAKQSLAPEPEQSPLEQITNPFGEAFRQVGDVVGGVASGALEALRPGAANLARGQMIESQGDIEAGRAANEARREYFPSVLDPNHPSNVMTEMLEKYPGSVPGQVDEDRMTPEERRRWQEAQLFVGGMALGGAGGTNIGRGGGLPRGNPFHLDVQPGPGRVPLSEEQLLEHAQTLEAQYATNAVRIEELEDFLDGIRSAAPVQRPPWATGMSDRGIQAVAKHFDLNPYEEMWWSKAELVSGAGEMEDVLSYFRNVGNKQFSETLSPTAMKQELTNLRREQRQLTEAADQIAEPGTFYRLEQTTGDLPFDRPPEQPPAGTVAGGGQPAIEPAAAPTVAGPGAQIGGQYPPNVAAGSAARPTAPVAAGVQAAQAGGVTPTGQATLPGVFPRAAAAAAAAAAAPPPGAAPRPPAGMQLRLGRGPNGRRANDTLRNMYGGMGTAPRVSIPGALEEARRFAVRKWTDRGVDLAEFQKEAERAAGRRLTPEENAYQLRRLNPSGAADIRIQDELRPAIQGVGEDVDWLRVYLTHMDNIDVGKQMGNPNRAFSGGLSAADSEAGLADMAADLGPERMAKVEQSAQQIWDYGRSLLERKRDAGLISQDLYTELTEVYPHYSPTRIVDYLKDPAGVPSGRKITVQSSGLRRNTAEGTTRQREDPLASFVRLAHESEALATKNEVAQAFIKLRDMTPDGKLMIREVADDATTPRGFEKMKVFSDGTPQTYMMPDYIARAIREEPVAPIPIMTPLMNFFRAVATQRNPVFLASNALTDFVTATVRGSVRAGGPQHAPRVAAEVIKAYGDTFKGILSQTYQGADTAKYLREGGGMAGFFSKSPEDAAKVADALQRSNAFEIRSGHQLEDVKRLIGQALTLKPIEAIGERIELAPRVAAMREAERAGKSTQEAVLAGRTVTMDFSQGGTWAKVLNQAIPFFNVAVQSGATLPRAFAENPRGFAATAMGMLAAPTVAMEAWNRSDPQRAKDYEDVPQYVKDAGLVFMLPGAESVDEKGNRKPQYLFLPTREYSPFVVLTREAAGRAMGQDPRAWDELLTGTLKSVSPIQGESGAEMISTGVPLGVSTGMQLATDRDWFRNRRIVSEQADEQSAALSKGIASALQSMGIEARPSAVEFGIRDIGAGVGASALAASDMLTGKPRRDEQLQSTPGVGGLIGRFVQGRTGERLSDALEQPVPPEIARALKDADVPVPTIPPTISVRNQATGDMSPPIELRQAERVEYQRLMSERLTEQLAPRLADPNWTSRPIDQRNREIRDRVSAARAYAESQVFSAMEREDRTRRMQAGREKQRPVARP